MCDSWVVAKKVLVTLDVPRSLALADLAEIDRRQLYRAAGYSSLFAYCLGELPLSEDSAYKRIQAARRFPAIFPAVAEGRLHLTAVVLLAPHLTPENAGELLAAAARKTRAQVEQLLAGRFPRPDLPTRLEPLSPPAAQPQPVTLLVPEPVPGPGAQLVPEPVPAPAPAPVPPARMTPLSPQRFGLQLTIGQETHDLLRYAQSLLGHRVPSGDLEAVIRFALESAIPALERQKFAATSRPRRTGRPSSNPRHIPAHVKRAVWERDGGQCTVLSESARRCPARKFLEFDHVEEVARGGQASVAGIRLRCRAHNQYTAECTFGADFMRHKREEERRAAESRREEPMRVRGARPTWHDRAASRAMVRAGAADPRHTTEVARAQRRDRRAEG